MKFNFNLVLGQKNAKKQVSDFIKQVRFHNELNSFLNRADPISPCNLAFLGPVGTGKRRFAEHVGEYLCEMESIPCNGLVRVTPPDLISDLALLRAEESCLAQGAVTP